MKGNFSGPLNQVRSKEEVERLVNLICLSYSARPCFFTVVRFFLSICVLVPRKSDMKWDSGSRWKYYYVVLEDFSK